MSTEDGRPVSPADVTAMGPDAVALLIELMSRNDRETGKIQQDLIAALQRDYEATLAEVSMIRRNVMIVLRRPHTDLLIEEALFAARPLPDPDARP
jgi:hypothetical protein